jgi:hypothetical protein
MGQLLVLFNRWTVRVVLLLILQVQKVVVCLHFYRFLRDRVAFDGRPLLLLGMLLVRNFFPKKVDRFHCQFIGRLRVLLLEHLEAFLHHLDIIAADAHVLLKLLFLCCQRWSWKFGREFLMCVLLLLDHHGLVLESAVLLHKFLRRELILRRWEVAVK